MGVGTSRVLIGALTPSDARVTSTDEIVLEYESMYRIGACVYAVEHPMQDPAPSPGMEVKTPRVRCDNAYCGGKMGYVLTHREMRAVFGDGRDDEDG